MRIMLPAPCPSAPRSPQGAATFLSGARALGWTQRQLPIWGWDVSVWETDGTALKQKIKLGRKKTFSFSDVLKEK